MARQHGPRRRKTIPRSRRRRRRNPVRPSAPPSHSRHRGASARNSGPGRVQWVVSPSHSSRAAHGTSRRKAAWKIPPRDKLVEPRDPPPHRWRSTMSGPCLGSKISRPLVPVERRLPDDWERRYVPVLLETFRETPRWNLLPGCQQSQHDTGSRQRPERTRSPGQGEAPTAKL